MKSTLTEIERQEIERRLKSIEENLWQIRHILEKVCPTETPNRISFKETSMLPPVAGNTLVYTGTLSPSGAVFPADSVFAVTSSDSTVTPTVDSTGLIVTIPLPGTFVDSGSFVVSYTATGTGMSLSATITPSVPVPTGISFQQTA
jgi:hypothetical protein